MQIIDLFDVEVVSRVSLPGVFQGAPALSLGEYKGYKYRSELKGLEYYSTISDPSGQEVAYVDRFISLGGYEYRFWVVTEQAPEFLQPLGAEAQKFLAEEEVLQAENEAYELEAEKCKADFTKLKARYRGTRLFEFLRKQGRPELIAYA